MVLSRKYSFFLTSLPQFSYSSSIPSHIGPVLVENFVAGEVVAVHRPRPGLVRAQCRRLGRHLEPRTVQIAPSSVSSPGPLVLCCPLSKDWSTPTLHVERGLARVLASVGCWRATLPASLDTGVVLDMCLAVAGLSWTGPLTFNTGEIALIVYMCCHFCRSGHVVGSELPLVQVSRLVKLWMKGL